MHSIEDVRARLARLVQPGGSAARDLSVAGDVLRLTGLSDVEAATLDARWGGFVGEARSSAPQVTVRVVRGDGATWVPRWRPGESYRIEADAVAGPLLVRSYHFALAPEGSGVWRLAVEASDSEPVGRILENAARYLVARLALERGGIALHGAGVKRGGVAWVFTGKSGAGKSTAARLSAPAEMLGDDFAVLLPTVRGWAAAALPFDNSEAAPPRPVLGLTPVAGVFRLFQADRHVLERPSGVWAQASIMACTAFPWALPDLSGHAGDAIARLAASGLFGHLHFAQDSGFWALLSDPDVWRT